MVPSARKGIETAGPSTMERDMLEVLEFIFGSFWRWLGTLFLIGAAAEGIGGFIRIRIRR